MSTIKKLFYELTENLRDSEGFAKANKEYDKVYEKISELIPDQIELMNELFVQTGGLENEYGLMCFKAGLRLALSLAVECLT